MLRLCRFLFQIISAITWYHSDFPPVSLSAWSAPPWLRSHCSFSPPTTRVRCEGWGWRSEVYGVYRECEVRGMKCEAWSVRYVRYEMWGVSCEVWSVRCEVWGVRWTWDSEDQITNKVLLVIIIEGIPQTAIYLILSIGLIPVFVRFSCLQRFFPFSCLAGRGRWGQTCKDLRIRRFMVCGLCVGVKWQEWETEKQIHTCSASKYFSLSSIKFYILNLFRQIVKF